jgi:hypothetical protein
MKKTLSTTFAFVWTASFAGAPALAQEPLPMAWGELGFACVATEDIDGDGSTDVIAVSPNLYDDEPDLFLWLGNDKQREIAWTPQGLVSDFNFAAFVWTEDVDGDGDADIIAGANADENDGLAWWENDGQRPPSWVKRSIDANFRGIVDGLSVDLDLDGKPDLAAVSQSGELAWWRHNGERQPGWTRFDLADVPSGARRLHADDLDEDGDPDLLIASEDAGALVWRENPKNQPDADMGDAAAASEENEWKAWEIAELPGARSVFTEDLDGDGDADIIAASNDGLTWWENIREGGEFAWTRRDLAPDFSSARAVWTEDLDGDFHADIIAAGDAGLAWWRSEAMGQEQIREAKWDSFVIEIGLKDVRRVVTDDIDNDGDADILGAAQGIESPVWWQNADPDAATAWEKRGFPLPVEAEDTNILETPAEAALKEEIEARSEEESER